MNSKLTATNTSSTATAANRADLPADESEVELTPPANRLVASPRVPALQFAVLCLDFVEEERRPPTCRYLFYQLPVSSLPFRMDEFAVVTCWVTGQGAFRQAVKIRRPSGSTLIETGEQPFVLEDRTNPQLMINRFVEVEFSEQGQHLVEIHLNDAVVLEFPLVVHLRAGEENS